MARRKEADLFAPGYKIASKRKSAKDDLKERLTPKQSKFVDEYINGAYQMDAARVAGYKHTSQSLLTPKVRAAIDARLRERSINTEELKEEMVQMLYVAIEKCMSDEHFSPSGLASLATLVAKLNGWLTDKLQVTGKIETNHTIQTNAEGLEAVRLLMRQQNTLPPVPRTPLPNGSGENNIIDV